MQKLERGETRIVFYGSMQMPANTQTGAEAFVAVKNRFDEHQVKRLQIWNELEIFEMNWKHNGGTYYGFSLWNK